jgi:hypothetical protein
MIATAFLRYAKATHLPDEADVILDDLTDSGATMKRYQDKYPGKEYYSLFDKSRMEGDPWVIFPWEAAESPVQENIMRILQYMGVDKTLRPGLIALALAGLELYRGKTISDQRNR